MKQYALYLAWLLSCLGLLGSLYFSEMRHLEPCHLCWYQRIALYPLAFILGIAAYRGFLGIILYVYPLIVIGLVVSLYHVLIQEIPNWQPIELCGAGPSCSDKLDIGLGPITIPLLSSLTFLTIASLLSYAWRKSSKKEKIKFRFNE